MDRSAEAARFVVETIGFRPVIVRLCCLESKKTEDDTVRASQISAGLHTRRAILDACYGRGPIQTPHRGTVFFFFEWEQIVLGFEKDVFLASVEVLVWDCWRHPSF